MVGLTRASSFHHGCLLLRDARSAAWLARRPPPATTRDLLGARVVGSESVSVLACDMESQICRGACFAPRRGMWAEREREAASA